MNISKKKPLDVGAEKNSVTGTEKLLHFLCDLS